MVKKKRPKSFFDEIFGSFFSDFDSLFEKGFTGSSGYSIQVTYTNEGPVVRAKIYGDADKDAIKAQLQQEYPNAKIIIEDESGKIEELSLIQEIKSEKPIEPEKEKETATKKKKSSISLLSSSGSKPLIREIDDNES
ncbi:MAG: hypothetical protein ACP6IU_14960 [Candidatus Asgardarchaeia archaeon]